jgi:hypothetical protein
MDKAREIGPSKSREKQKAGIGSTTISLATVGATILA